MESKNGYSDSFRARSVSIHKKGELDVLELELLLENLVKAVIKNTEASDKIQKSVDEINNKLAPVVSFHNNMRTAMAVAVLPFYFFIGSDGKGWVKDVLFNK